MSFVLSLAVLASGLLATPSLAQNATAGNGGNLTEVIANATAFAFPEMNLTTVTIEYQPPPLHINGSQHYTITFPPVRERVSYFTVDGLAIIDGDVIFGTEAELLQHVVPEEHGPIPVVKKDEHGNHQARHVPLSRRSLSFSRDDPRKWPGGVVQYYWESQDTKDAREDLFLQAVKVWTDRLPFLQFEDKGIKDTTTLNGPIILKLSEKSVSSSPLGRAESADSNYMVLGRTRNVGVYVHEIGHTLGLKHEQQRPDRDSYMSVDCSKVCGKYVYKPAPDDDEIDHCLNADCGPTTCWGHGCNFKQVPAGSAAWDWSGPYDVLSIMQYGSGLFARPETGWADPVTATDSRIPLRSGNGVHPTLTDLNRVCAIYYKECRGVCGDGILSLNNEELCDDGNNDDGDGCSAGCRKEFCGDGIIQPALGEVCDDGPLGSATCTPQCKRPCLEECDPDPRFNRCHITTSCIRIEGGTAASAGKHYCACAHGFRGNGATPADQSAQIRLPWVGQEGRVFVKPGLECNILCDQWTLGRDGCQEVQESNVCY